MPGPVCTACHCAGQPQTWNREGKRIGAGDPMNRKWDVFGRTADVIGIVGAVVAMLSLLVDAPVQQVMMAATLSVIAVTAAAAAWVQSRQLHSAAEETVQARRVIGALDRFANAVDHFKRAHQELPADDSEITPAAAQGFVNQCEMACIDAASAMKDLTGQDCRVVLQEIYSVDTPDGPRFAVRTIATSDRGGPTGEGTVDWVDENTDFSDLVGGEGIFFCEDLRDAIKNGYRNSHWTPAKLKEWAQSGGYPYLATVVTPVRARRKTDRKWHCEGFLSIDSKVSGAFDLSTVKPLAAALASVAYTGLSRYTAIKTKKNMSEKVRPGEDENVIDEQQVPIEEAIDRRARAEDGRGHQVQGH